MKTSAEAAMGEYPPAAERLKDICWDIGARFAAPFSGDSIIFAVVHPRLGYLHWHLESESVEALKQARGEAFNGATLVIRVYDVTDIEFDGFNAHDFFDLDVSGLSGDYYLPVHRTDRTFMSEAGFRLLDGAFQALARSNAVLFDRDRPSGRFHLGGLYVGRNFQRVFDVENVMDAPVYERLNLEIFEVRRDRPLRVAMVRAELDRAAGLGASTVALTSRLAEVCSKFHVAAVLFGPTEVSPPEHSLTGRVKAECAKVAQDIAAHHRAEPFDVLHCHDWPSVPAGLESARILKLPLVLSLHSTEFERSRPLELREEAAGIREWETRGVDAATLIIVPHSSTREQVTNLYGAPPSKVVIIADIPEEQSAALPEPADEKRNLGLDPDAPVVLFSGEISHAAGADLLMDALLTVCKENHQLQFIFAGEGPLKEELQGRAWHAGLGHRSRFLGDVSADWFERILMACNFVVIPARTWQDEGLAHMATSYGKPVLTTHQSHIRYIEHGQNGFITYDNPGSIVWGIKELLANPLHGNMLRLLARRRAAHTQSLESVAAEHYIAYERALAVAEDNDRE